MFLQISQLFIIMKVETLLLSGGGVHGSMYIGFLKRMEELVEGGEIELAYKEIGGVSVGSLFAFLLVIGYKYKELQKEFLAKDLKCLLRIQLSNLYNYGLDTGCNIIVWLESLLLRKLNKTRLLTFSELYELVPIKLSLYASNISRYELTCFNHDTTPNLEVLRALRMSISIPFLFTREIYNDDIFVDGMIIDTFPIHLYSSSIENGVFLGLKIKTNSNSIERRNPKTFEDYIYTVMSCYMFYRNNKSKLEEYKHCMIELWSPFSNHLNFDLTDDDKRIYIDKGYIHSQSYFDGIFTRRVGDIEKC